MDHATTRSTVDTNPSVNHVFAPRRANLRNASGYEAEEAVPLRYGVFVSYGGIKLLYSYIPRSYHQHEQEVGFSVTILMYGIGSFHFLKDDP